MRYTVLIESGPNNLSAYVPDLPGCVGAADTLEELIANMREAIEAHLELLAESGDPIPQSVTLAVEIEVELPSI